MAVLLLDSLAVPTARCAPAWDDKSLVPQARRCVDLPHPQAHDASPSNKGD